MDSDEGFASQQTTSTQSNEIKRGKNWSEDEDAQLCLSWLAISKDSVKGTDQNKTTFWMAIRQHAGANICSIGERPVDGLRQRFGQLSLNVSKYVGCLAFVSRANKSGETTDDKFQKARDLFLKETKQKHFKIQRCYEILKNEPKFQVASSNKRIKTGADASGESSSPSTVQCPDAADISEEQNLFSTPTTAHRPIGRNKAKRLQDGSNDTMLSRVADELKRKNELLERHALALERATELKLLTTSLDDLDAISRTIIKHQKMEIAKKYHLVGDHSDGVHPVGENERGQQSEEEYSEGGQSDEVQYDERMLNLEILNGEEENVRY